MLNVAVCDDTPLELDSINYLLSCYAQHRPEFDISVKTFSSPHCLLDELEKGNYFDVYILDIIMPGLDGLSLGRTIRKALPDAVIVYVTTSRDFALEAFSLYAFQYLIKPITEKTFFDVFDSITAKINQDSGHSIQIKTSTGMVNIYYSSVSNVECRGHVITFCLADGTSVVSSHMRIPFFEAVKPLVDDSRFISPHKSFIVNMDYVSRFNKSEFLMQDGSIIPISRNNYSRVKTHYLDYISKKHI